VPTHEQPHVPDPLVVVSTARGLALHAGMGSPHPWRNVPQRGSSGRAVIVSNSTRMGTSFFRCDILLGCGNRYVTGQCGEPDTVCLALAVARS